MSPAKNDEQTGNEDHYTMKNIQMCAPKMLMDAQRQQAPKINTLRRRMIEDDSAKPNPPQQHHDLDAKHVCAHFGQHQSSLVNRTVALLPHATLSLALSLILSLPRPFRYP